MGTTVVPRYAHAVPPPDQQDVPRVPSPIDYDPQTVPVRQAATVMLVRDGADGVEVAMLRRSLTASFVGGAYVFPGGAVDPQDAAPAALERVRGIDDATASALLGMTTGGLAYWIAAARESFEEAGLLVAEDAAGRPLSLHDDATVERFIVHRSDVHAGRRPFADVLVEEDLFIPAARIHPWSHWVTPIGPPRRFDTRFFVCAAPPGQEPLHDDRETIASIWLAPGEALTRHEAGEIVLILPTVKSLESIGRFPSVATLVDAAAQRGDVPVVLPPPAG